MKLLLASASPARRQTLLSAGIDPWVAVSDVDEEAILDALRIANPQVSPTEQVSALANAKAQSIYQLVVQRREVGEPVPDALVACDSMFAFQGEVVGKPHSPKVAFERLRRMRGRSGELFTGHTLIDVSTGRSTSAVSKAVIHMGAMSDAQIKAYIATGEPLEVAGSFTIDGVGGPFIDSIEGDHHGVVGISLPTVRKMMVSLGLNIVDFWERDAGRPRPVQPPVRLLDQQ
ncbi:septum formation protein [Arcanobacterium wilhelmae]|uniref:Nucleoside triphosphate pyrophosphatase n=1 Tax=Arcanobacterium wilhelmae TaxID=1803177 RepID=A0ABT9NC93_9ACTO|nr:nucleoside triphosphate pyrophosphatase [Arcanobacterium wilhelmae]MDP9801325.1 septum formation protein [Arcanobacterium wilhelmae]WFN90665.1 Maf family protein [Arcanobacterium wilhelmae]